ncbi:TadE/TadG family type IV pilus assembly protein [Streptomyces sp. NPDC052610]|uniref:TadE/TadG family type IV pilus assembly protein n=1 Tax=Streptomyces sp. NPDC052610 TaxID=3154952 RepID=UPI00343D07BD
MTYANGRRDRTSHRHDDRGQAALEYLGSLPLLLLVGMAAVQIGLVAHAAQQAGTAARAGARAASLGLDDQRACERAVSSRLADDIVCEQSPGGDSATVTATVRIPSVIPLWDPIGDARRTATMPLDR